MTLGDAPGGTEFIARLADAVQTLALVYANTPDVAAGAHLEVYLKTIEPHIVGAVGVDPAVRILEAFRGAVMGRKHEIEGGGSLSRALQ